MAQSKTKLGILCAFSGAVFWGFSGTCAEALMNIYGLDPLWISCWRMLVSGIFYLIFCIAKDRRKLIAMFKDAWTVKRLLCFTAFGLCFTQFAYLFAIHYSNAPTATLMQELGVGLIMIVTCVLARRLPSKVELIGLVLAGVGVFCIATQGNIDSLSMTELGLFWGFMAAIATLGYTLLPKPLLEKWGATYTLGVSSFILGIVLMPIIRPWHIDVELSLEAILALAAIIVVGTLLAYTLYMKGIQYAGPVRAALLGTMEPLSAMLFSAVWIGTPITVFDGIGCVCILSMVCLVTLAQTKR